MNVLSEIPARDNPSSIYPHLAIALGDPAGIGSEVVLKALADPALTQNCQITLVGSRSLLRQTYEQLAPTSVIIDPDRLSMIDVPIAPSKITQITPGVGNAATGAASFQFLETAIAHTLAGEFQGIVTAPIAKSAWKAAGHPYPGQTELLAEKVGIERFGMLFVGRSPHTGWTLRALLATTHIPLRQVPDALTPDLLTLKLDLLIDCLQQFGIVAPRIAIAGLNPHSGEQGQLGTEEIDWLIPWIKDMGDRYPTIHLDGPIPPDTMWVRPAQHWYSSQPSHSQAHDAYLALYHDQGLIPVKLMAFDRAVNTTIGLPFVRTSPDHGTAFDIAGQGIADATSMKAAIELAIELTQ
ncbi:MAG: 4-hydroxythreonine-4-phosphate dehydrogenase PdxA [Timaviella obliquedivisa GSE-PSE-MK23-08B]|jgi:4-hydroxythreonine-4-phosphate dehydrogenase|nr:4-hydroxythreonine-4-phosphate dehydrogenase PdxA [Timaviella obliquedivisa GSE-PSE-MK23-08B]